MWNDMEENLAGCGFNHEGHEDSEAWVVTLFSQKDWQTRRVRRKAEFLAADKYKSL